MSEENYSDAIIFSTILQRIDVAPVALLTDATTLKNNKNLLKFRWNIIFCVGSQDNSLIAPRNLDAEDFEDNFVPLKDNYPLVFFDESKLSKMNPFARDAFIQEKLKILSQIVDTGIVLIQDIPEDYYKHVFMILNSTRKQQKNIIVLDGQSSTVSKDVISIWKNEGRILLFKDPLSELLKSEDDNDDVLFIPYVEQGENLFIDSKLERIKSNTLDKIKHFAQLLTLESVDNTFPMITKADEPTFFQNFLENSSGGFPNWFWYSGNPVFYVRRDIEEDILSAVDNAFEAIESATREGSEPILLQGQNLSGKTNILCSIAYRVFCEKKYPVIFMPNTGHGSEWRFFKEELKFVLSEIKEKSKTPVLIVWDTACEKSKDYNNITDFRKEFDWYGFKTVILGSGYVTELDSHAGIKCLTVEPKLSADEFSRFENVMVGKRIFDKAEFSAIREKYSEEPTFLASLYWLWRIRPILRDHVSREISSVLDDWQDIVNKVLEEIIKNSLNTTWAIFNDEFSKLKFDESPEESLSKNEENDTDNVTVESLKKAMGCLALCSIYSCPLNIEFFVRLIKEKVADIPAWDLYKLCTHNNMLREVTEMPSPTYQFRSILEAKLFLSLCERSRYSQFEMLMDLINTASQDHEIDLLIRLLTASGPNAKGIHDNRDNIWAKNSDKYPVLWNLLAEKRKDPYFEKLLPLEKSFIREWYKQRLHRESVNESIGFKESSEFKDELLAAYNELSNSKDELLAAYNKMSQRRKDDFVDDLQIKILVEYTSTIIFLLDDEFNEFDRPDFNFEKLTNAFLSIPDYKWEEDSYIPTNFLYLGCRLYEKIPDTDRDQKLASLSRLLYYADCFSSGNADENIERAIQSVYAKMDEFTGETSCLDESIENQKPSAISVRVRASLWKFGKNGHGGFRKEHIKSLLEDYLENADYTELVEKDRECLLLRIALKWEFLTGRATIVPHDNSERIRIGLSKTDWQYFYDQCVTFMQLNTNNSILIPSHIKFLRVLSYIHSSNDYNYNTNGENWLQGDEKRSEFGRKSLYLICNENGQPFHYHGINKFWDTNNRRGKVEITHIDEKTFYNKVTIDYYRPEDLGFTRGEAKQIGKRSSAPFCLTLTLTGLKVDRGDQ